MADASDSKSDEGDFVRVQVPPSAVNLSLKGAGIYRISGTFYIIYPKKGIAVGFS